MIRIYLVGGGGEQKLVVACVTVAVDVPFTCTDSHLDMTTCHVGNREPCHHHRRFTSQSTKYPAPFMRTVSRSSIGRVGSLGKVSRPWSTLRIEPRPSPRNPPRFPAPPCKSTAVASAVRRAHVVLINLTSSNCPSNPPLTPHWVANATPHPRPGPRHFSPRILPPRSRP